MKKFITIFCCLACSWQISAQGFTPAQLVIDSLMSRGKYVEALPLATALYEEVFGEPNADFTQKVIVLRMVAVCTKNTGKPDQSRELMKNFVEKSDTNGQRNNPSIATILAEWASLEIEQRRFDDAEKLLLEAKHLADSSGLVPINTQANILSFIGRLYLTKSEMEKAEPAFIEAINFMEERNREDLRIYMSTCYNLSLIYMLWQNEQDMEKYANKALATAKRRGFPYRNIMLAAAGFQLKKGNFRSAEKLYLEIKALMEAANERNTYYANVLYNLGMVYRNVGYYETEYQLFLEAYQLYMQLNLDKSNGYYESITEYATSLTKQKRFEEAEKLLQSTQESLTEIEINQKYKLNFEFEMLNNCQARDGLLKTGPRYEVFREKVNGSQFNGKNQMLLRITIKLADYWLDAGNFETFTSEINRAYQLLDSLDFDREYYEKSVLAHDFGTRAFAGRYEEAAQIYLPYLKKTWERLGKYLPSFSSADRIKYYNDLKQPLDFYLQCCSVSERFPLLEEVLDYQINMKSLLLDFDRSTKKKLTESPDEAIRDKYHKWQNQRERYFNLLRNASPEVVENDAKPQQLKTSIETLERELLQASDAFKNLRSPKSTNCAQIRAALPPEAAAIEIFRIFKPNLKDKKDTDTVLYGAIVIRKNQPSAEMVFFRSGNEMEAFLLEQYRTQASSKKQNKEIASQLYQAFWQPLTPLLEGIRTVFISADGVFHQINPEILQQPDGRYLSDVYELRRVNVLADILHTSTESGVAGLAGKSAILFGNPDFNGDGAPKPETIPGTTNNRGFLQTLETERGLKLTALPGSENEVRSVAVMLQAKGLNAEAFTQKEATEGRIKSVHAPAVLHVATHGYFLENPRKSKENIGLDETAVRENPMLRTMLFFAGAQNTLDHEISTDDADDGVLTAEEAQNLDLEGCELVVLSACNTGLGKIESGEGVFGLQRAFRIAGAKTVIMSLWQVEDNVTQLLMTTFYAKWLGGMTKQEAFLVARKAVRKKYPEPFFWGAFVMLGEE